MATVLKLSDDLNHFFNYHVFGLYFLFIGDQFKDFCFTPSESLNYNSFAQIWQLTQRSIVPVSYVVPKNSRMSKPKNEKIQFIEVFINRISSHCTIVLTVFIKCDFRMI